MATANAVRGNQIYGQRILSQEQLITFMVSHLLKV